MVIELSEIMSTFLEDETGNHITDELALQVRRIYERAQHETLALLQSRPSQKELVPRMDECYTTCRVLAALQRQK